MVVPLPDTSVIRARFIYTGFTGQQQGSRIFFRFTGGAPSPADLVTLAGLIEAAYAAHLNAVVHGDFTLTEILLQDITTDVGNQGAWLGSLAGGLTGSQGPPVQCPMNVQYLIPQHYRGGKPKGFWPFGGVPQWLSVASFTTAFVATVNAAFAAWIAACIGATGGTTVIAAHTNLSYRLHNAERAVAAHSDVTGYSAKQIFGSQRRRRTSTTP